ncbi:hypothetical protein FRC10_008884 [Ceratobasidium sp. 414]|nr:hypothetical protein FRC10_008884 [Ceratobasidium sp. 414]
MASGGQQPEGFSMVDFDGKHAELIRKLSEISTSMRQCADIVDSFNQIVRHLSLRPTPFEVGIYPQASAPGPSRISGYPRPERADAVAYAEAPGVAPSETYRRPSYSHVGGSMLPPAVPTYHPSGFPSSHPSTSSSMHAMPGPPSYPLQRTGGATSGPGPAGSHDTTGLGQRPLEGETTASERASPKHGKRKRTRRTGPVQPGDESDDGAAIGGSSPQETTDVASEAEGTPRRPKQPARGSEESSGASRMSSRGQAGVESARTEDRPTDPATGPSIVVFASGAGTSRPRAASSRSQAQTSSGRARKEKKPRDPNAPKQPPPAYIVYQNEIRELAEPSDRLQTMRGRFPGHSPTELVKEIAATWKTLPNSERQVRDLGMNRLYPSVLTLAQRYKDYANVEKDRWVTELAAYQATLLTADESQPAKSSEGSFLAAAGISDSPPASSPHQSPRISEVEGESHDVRRVASQDAPSSSSTYGYAYQAPLRTSSSLSGLATTVAGTSSPRPGAEGGPGYPPRLERPHSRLASTTFGSYGRASPLHIPSPPTARPHFTGLHPDSRGPSTRLPSFDSLGLGHPLPSAREPSPRPSKEHAEGEDEPASKRQRTRVSPSEVEEGDGGFSHSTYDERKGE